ncbi:MAG: hypothetical protein WA746_15090 [Isosphaeraceae bacterium]
MTVSSLAGSLLILGLLAQTPEKPDRWSTIRSAEGDFSAMLPSQASSNTQEVSTPAGKVEQEIHFCRLNGSLFTVQRIRLGSVIPSGQAAAWLAAQRKTYFENGARPAAERKLQRDGLSGEEFGYVAPAPGGKGTVTSRTQHYLRGRDYYALTVMSAPDGPLPAEAERFFASFHLAEPAAAGPSGPSRSHSGTALPRSEAREKIADRTPEDALRTFVYAMAVRDEPTLRAITLPVEGFEWLMAGRAAPAGLIQELKEKLAQQTFRSLKAGDKFTLPQGQAVVVKAEDVGPDRALLLPEGASLPTRLQKVEGHWKVDPRAVIAGRKAAEAARRNAAQKNSGAAR